MTFAVQIRQRTLLALPVGSAISFIMTPGLFSLPQSTNYRPVQKLLHLVILEGRQKSKKEWCQAASLNQ